MNTAPQGGPQYERRDIWSLSSVNAWHPIIAWYARAIAELKSIGDDGDPRSWTYLASIHGSFLDRGHWPPGVHDWNSCQHASWFFLPWHRVYLHHFETIIRQTVVALGGPSDWALPFWNYNPADPPTLALPPAFRSPGLPPDLADEVAGGTNPLFVQERRPAMNGGAPLNPTDVEIGGWTAWFTTDSTVVPSFGGPRTGLTHMGPALGQLELEPHGLVHMRVGGQNPDGLMTLFQTAGRDPIFWLHHANIDRLWEVWRNETGHENPTDGAWVGQPFDFGRGNVATSLTAGQVTDTTAPPLRYRYEGVAPPSVSVVPPLEGGPVPGLAGAEGRDEEEMMDKGAPPELVGASEEPVPLGGAITEVQVQVRRPAGPLGIDAVDRASQYYLALENVTGAGLGAGTYGVYVQVPDGLDPTEFPDRRVGHLSTFGVPERSRSDEAHDGSGVTYPFDVTDIVRRLTESGEWNPDQLRVSIVPDDAEGEVAPESGEVQVGRVSLYTR